MLIWLIGIRPAKSLWDFRWSSLVLCHHRKLEFHTRSLAHYVGITVMVLDCQRLEPVTVMRAGFSCLGYFLWSRRSSMSLDSLICQRMFSTPYRRYPGLVDMLQAEI